MCQCAMAADTLSWLFLPDFVFHWQVQLQAARVFRVRTRHTHTYSGPSLSSQTDLVARNVFFAALRAGDDSDVRWG